MDFPKNLKYTKDHEWVKLDGDTALMGITEFAQSELGEVVFVDLPEKGKKLSSGGTACVVESTKAASDVYAPISGTVAETNEKLKTSPELVNSSPYTDGWMVKLSGISQAEIAKLMSSDDYSKLVNK